MRNINVTHKNQLLQALSSTQNIQYLEKKNHSAASMKR